MIAKILATALLVSTPVWAQQSLPDPRITPGVTNPEVTQENIHATICVRGWTAAIRPPSSYTSSLKRKQIKEMGYLDRNAQHYEEDHRLPLSAGGHPYDEHNLWPEIRSNDGHCHPGIWTSECKDELEIYVSRNICSGKMSLEQGQKAFLGDWTDAYSQLIGGHKER